MRLIGRFDFAKKRVVQGFTFWTFPSVVIHTMGRLRRILYLDCPEVFALKDRTETEEKAEPCR